MVKIYTTQVRKRPAIPLSMWNKHVATLRGEARTNNAMEGYNRTFSMSIPAKASEWFIMDRFRDEESVAKTGFVDAAMGRTSPEANKWRTKSRQAREEELKQLVGNYDNMSIKLFVESVMGFYGD